MPTSLVTGANRGIGLELTRQLKSRGHDVIAVVRRSSSELDATGVRVIADVDVADDAGVTKLAAELGDTQLDLLVNNAGLLEVDNLVELDLDVVRRQIEVNALGPLRVTKALLPRLGKGSKVALVTSRMGSIADNGSGAMYGYRMSKAALNMAGVSLARDLAGRGIAVVLLHPGMVATDMTARFGDASGMQRADETATKLLARIDELTLATSGRFVHSNGEALPW
ncbi:MAG: SDR family oxidoreductase [Deltaproteobacteria bacterium]|nr:SDR family oxidoreductase [Nannocystaceae bacterium]